MANYTTLRQGNSYTEDTRKLQLALMNAGYGSYLGNAGADGIYGSGTAAAVKEYQKDKGLQVDGIAGDETLGSLYETQAPQQPAQETQTPEAETAAPAQNYQYNADEDPVYTAARQKVEELEGQQPVIRGTYDQQVEQLYQDILDQKGFRYDLNEDPLWSQYKDQYTTQGKLAMMDTMGQAAALTGGYSNSYAQGAGQQAYQGYLQRLNDRIPELQQLALQRYQLEQDAKERKWSAAKSMQDEEYARDRDAQSDWLAQLGFAREDANTAYERGQTAWLTEEQLRREDENTAYGKQQDAYSTLQAMIAATGYVPSQAELAAAGMSLSQAEALAAQYVKDNTPTYSGGSSDPADPEYVRPDVDGPERAAFLEEYEKFGEDAAIQWAEAYNIHPSIIESWLRTAQFEQYGDNYFDPGA